MADAKSIIAAIKNTKPVRLADAAMEHPFGFALAVGVGNGLLAVARGKHIDLKTGIALAGIIGIGETVIAAFEPGEHKRSNLKVGIYSVLGIGIGLLPFLRLGSEGAAGLPIASAEGSAEGKVA